MLEKYWSDGNILRRLSRETETVTLKSSAPVVGQLCTLPRATEKKFSPKHSHGTAGSVRFHDTTQQGYVK